MSSEIRAGNSRTYWIINNGSGYVDGVTDPNLVTTVGNGWYIYWIGSNYNEYLSTCTNIGILPRISNPLTNTTSTQADRLSARQIRLWLINNNISLDRIDSAIDTIEDTAIREKVRIEWEWTPYVEKTHPWLAPLVLQLGLTTDDINRAFIEGILL